MFDLTGQQPEREPQPGPIGDIVDWQEPCMACQAKGYRMEREWRGTHYVTVYEDCHRCRGTGRKTVRVGE